MTPYQRGVRLEYLARDVLRHRGYSVVRSAGSHGAIDLVALNEREVLLIQVKQTGQSVGAALDKLSEVPGPRCAHRQVWVYHPARGRLPARWQVTDETGQRPGND